MKVRNLAYDCKLVLRHVKNILKSERNNGSRLNTEKGELYFPRKTTRTQYNTIIGQFQKVYPKIKLKSMDELEFLGSPIGESCRKDLLNEKTAELEKISEVMISWMQLMVYLLKKALASRKSYFFLFTNP